MSMQQASRIWALSSPYPAVSMSMPPAAIAASDLPEILLRDALDFWCRLGDAGAVAPMADRLDLSQMDRRLLPHLALTTAPAEKDGRILGLFIGSAAAIAVGRDIAGRYLDEVYPPALYSTAYHFLALIAQTGRPVYETFEIGQDAGQRVMAARLGMPLFDRKGQVSRILLALHYRSCDRARSAGVRILQERSRLHHQTAHLVEL